MGAKASTSRQECSPQAQLRRGAAAIFPHRVGNLPNVLSAAYKRQRTEPNPLSRSTEVEAMSDEHLKAELERLRKENEALKKGASSSVRMKVSEKGALSIYGMGRFPVTLYKEQWLKLLEMSDDIRAFIAAHEAELKAKD
jgi:hypothetical protein